MAVRAPPGLQRISGPGRESLPLPHAGARETGPQPLTTAKVFPALFSVREYNGHGVQVFGTPDQAVTTDVTVRCAAQKEEHLKRFSTLRAVLLCSHMSAIPSHDGSFR